MTTCGIIQDIKTYFKTPINRNKIVWRECFFRELQMFRYYKAEGITKGQRSVWHLIYWQGVRAARAAEFHADHPEANF